MRGRGGGERERGRREERGRERGERKVREERGKEVRGSTMYMYMYIYTMHVACTQFKLTGVDGSLSSSHRHVGGVGH